MATKMPDSRLHSLIFIFRSQTNFQNKPLHVFSSISLFYLLNPSCFNSHPHATPKNSTYIIPSPLCLYLNPPPPSPGWLIPYSSILRPLHDRYNMLGSTNFSGMYNDQAIILLLLPIWHTVFRPSNDKVKFRMLRSNSVDITALTEIFLFNTSTQSFIYTYLPDPLLISSSLVNIPRWE